MLPTATSAIILLTRCPIPKCRKQDVISLQYCPSRIYGVYAAPSRSIVSVLPGLPANSVRRNMTALIKNSTAVTGYVLRKSSPSRIKPPNTKKKPPTARSSSTVPSVTIRIITLFFSFVWSDSIIFRTNLAFSALPYAHK